MAALTESSAFSNGDSWSALAGDERWVEGGVATAEDGSNDEERKLDVSVEQGAAHVLSFMRQRGIIGG